MKKLISFLPLAVVMIALFLTACQKEDFPENPDASGLYLKSAAAGDFAKVIYFNKESGQIEKLNYPDNILFSLDGQEAKILNNFWLQVEDFSVLSAGEIFFRVSPINSKATSLGEINGQAVYSSNSENAVAIKLPPLNFGKQSNVGAERFNGLLKAGNYVLAVNGLDVQIFDLGSNEKPVSVRAAINEEALTFKVYGQTWLLRFVSPSPIGNIFSLSLGDSQISVYSLRF